MITPPQLRSNTCCSLSPATDFDIAADGKIWVVDSSRYLALSITAKKRVRFHSMLPGNKLEPGNDSSSGHSSPHDSADDPSEYNQSCRWSRSDISSFRLQARDDAIEVIKRRPECAEDLALIFQQCLEKKQATQAVVQRLCSSADSSRLRGLETTALPALRKHRLYHMKKLLSIQEKCRSQDLQTRQQILKTVSMETSRPFRIMARVLAAVDSTQVAALLQNELKEQALS